MKLLPRKAGVLTIVAGLTATVLPGCNPQAARLPSVDIRAVRTLALQGPESGHTYLVAPFQAVHVQDDTYLVGDRRGPSLVWARDDGSLLATGFSHGSAPFEFNGLADFAVAEDRILLLDDVNRRLIQLGLRSGAGISSTTVRSAGVPRRVAAFGTFLAIALSGPSLGRLPILVGSLDRPDSLTALWSTSLARDLPPARKDNTVFDPGRICFTPTGELIFSPMAYDGWILNLGPIENHRVQVWQGVPIAGRAVHPTTEGQMEVRFETRGLICDADGSVLHFWRDQVGDESQLNVQVFGADGVLQNAGSLEGVRFPKKEFWDFHVSVVGRTRDRDVLLIDADSLDAPRLRIAGMGL